MADWEIEMYATLTGREPVSEWLESMSPGEQADALSYIDLLAQAGAEARRPLVAPLRNKLYELRWKFADKQHRIIYFAVSGRKFVLLHGFIKKTNAVSPQDFQKAQDRMNDYTRRSGA